ncbi:hypothetical protein [Mucilaginibacter sp. PAMB04168]|uniref:hypothetical protein n=1 Tax=Mucilaginibacter sp. PAMB04168 TaxID=3138567 RepID=UPI0031F5FC2B
MKKNLKIVLALVALANMLVACDANGNKNTGDTTLVDSSSSAQSTTDTTYKVDSTKVDTSALGDSSATAAAGDTVSKTITKKTVVKKTVSKKQ